MDMPPNLAATAIGLTYLAATLMHLLRTHRLDWVYLLVGLVYLWESMPGNAA